MAKLFSKKALPKTELESKLPYVKVTLNGTKSFIEEILGFLKVCLDWYVTKNITPISEADVLVTHGLDEGAEYSISEFWIVKKGKRKG